MSASTSLVFRLIGIDAVTPATKSAAAGMAKAGTAVIAAGAIIAAESLKMAAHWETAMTRTVTGAGEARSAIASDSKALLAMMGPLGATADGLGAAFYNINSAGHHAAEGLKITEVAAKGARVGAADLLVTADALTTMINAYKLGAAGANHAMNVLIGTEVYGKATLEQLAKAFPTVATTASITGITMEELGGAMATMTHFGVDAAKSATYLRSTILQLSAPSVKARKAMESVGLKAEDVSRTLGKHGLGAALNEISDAIRKKMGPDGIVLMNSLAKASGSTSDYEKALTNLTPKQRTYVGALSDMTGGVKSMQAALMLSGPYAAEFSEYTKGISDRVKEAGDDVEGWADVQDTLNFKLAAFKGSVQSVGIALGNYLLPYAKKAMDKVNEFAQALQDGSGSARMFAKALGYVAAALATAKLLAVFGSLKGMLKVLGAVMSEFVAAVGWPVTLALLAIAGALTLVYKKTDWLQRAWATAFPQMKAVYQDFVGLVTNADGALDRTKQKIRDLMMIGEIRLKVHIDRILDSAAETFKNPGKQGSKAVDSTIESAKDIAGKAGPGLASGLSSSMNLIPVIAGAVRDAFGKLPGIISREVPRVGSAIFHGLGQALQFALRVFDSIPGTIKHAFSQIGPGISGAAQAAGPWIMNAFASIGSWIVNSLPGVLLTIIKLVGSVIVQGLGFFIEAIGFLIGTAVQIFMRLPGLIGDALMVLGKVGWEAAKWFFSKVGEGFTVGIPMIINFLGGLPDEIHNWFIKQDWMQIGKDILGGIIEGLKWGVGKLGDAAQWLAEKFETGFKEALGINSPSKVMMGHGRGIVEGLVTGVTSQHGEATRSAKALGDGFSRSFMASTKTPKRGYGGGEGAAPAGHGPTEPPRVEFGGDREVVAFVRKLVKNYGGGSVDTTFGGARR